MSFVNTSALQGTACQLPTLLHLTGTENPSAMVLWSLFDGEGFLTTPASPELSPLCFCCSCGVFFSSQ